jgi:type II secretory pathway pseudopilin PulG
MSLPRSRIARGIGIGIAVGIGRRSRGYAMMLALFALVLVSLAAIAAIGNSRQAAQREREQDLLWVGNQYRQAIDSYYRLAARGFAVKYPESLDDLLEDNRLPVPVHHLRRIYPDPMTGAVDWVLERQAGRIVGLHSASARAPIRHAGFAPADRAFTTAHTYREWRFIATAVSEAELAAAGGTTDAGSGSGAPGTPPAPGASPPGGPPTAGPPGSTDVNPLPPALLEDPRIQCYLQWIEPAGRLCGNLRSCLVTQDRGYFNCLAQISPTTPLAP